MLNTTQSKLQTKFPLSPKKFWKKFIEQSLSGVAVSFAIALISVIVFIAMETSPWLKVVLVFLLLVAITCLISSWYVKAYIRSYYYEAETDYLTIRKGVFTSAEIHVPYQKIQDVYVDQDFSDRFLFGLYDVHIASATFGSAIEAHIDGVEKENAEGLKNYLLNRMSGKSDASSLGVNNLSEKIEGNKIAFNLNKKITNIEYPITKNWWTVSIVRGIGTALVASIVTFLAIVKIDSKAENGLMGYAPVSMIVIFIISLIWQIIKLHLFKKNYLFDFTSEYLYMRNGILTMSENHTPYNTIQDIRIQQSFFEKICGIYNIVIENAAMSGLTGSVIIGLSKESSSELFDILKNNILNLHNKNKI
jgi:membrane protein YdbS with pleckstrin-like domain